MSQNAAKMGQNAAGKMKPFVDRNFGFGMKALRKYPELLPLTIMCGIGYAVGFAYMGFGLVAKADVRINPWEKVARSERTDVSNMTKVHDNVKHGSIPELDALRREMGLHEYK